MATAQDSRPLVPSRRELHTVSVNMQTIFDVGMHVGKDTQFYLEKGFRVVAIEARPDLIEESRRKFRPYVDAGLLEIVPCAIAKCEGSATFYVFPEKDDWGTLDEGYAQRNIERGKKYYKIEVPALPFSSILERYGVPYYLKIDIEGADILCVEALHEFSNRPKYLSMETHLTNFDQASEAVAQLIALGYRQFKVVNQAVNYLCRCPYPALEGEYVDARFDSEMSGPFGEEAPGVWRDAKETLASLRRITRIQKLFSAGGPLHSAAWIYDGICRRLGGEPLGWYDLHASLKS